MLAAALGGLLTVLVGVVPAPSYAASRAEEQTPLAVTIGSLSPSALVPRAGGTVTLTGTVTNTADAPWLDVTVYPFASAEPMTTTAELAEAAATDESADVGHRIVTDLARIGDLQPGQTTSYTLSLPRDDLPSAPGVYWFGVHALGSGPDGADGLADGRARTFLPLLRAKTTPVRAAMLMPLRVHVMRNPDGSVAALTSWQRLLSSNGRLGKARGIGTSAAGRSLSWLVDPALLDALRQLAAGNPPRDISPTEKPPGDTSGSPSPTPSPTASAAPAKKADPQTAAVATLASGWLDAMVPVLRDAEVLALPYGDLDLPAAAAHDPDSYGTARTRSVAFFESLGIPATQVDAPPNGVISHDGLTMTDSASPLVLADTALPEDLAWGEKASPPVVDTGSRRIAVSSSEAGSGGPGPGDPQADVPLRQRVLAEAAVRALDPARPPLVMTLPQHWNPADPVGFLDGLSQPWLDIAGLAAATSGQVAPTIDPAAMRYPTSAAREELSGARFASANALVKTGRSLQRVLTRNDTVASEVVDEALTDVGYSARASLSDDALSSRSWIETQLGQIEVQGPSGVTLSGASGRFAATVVNGLDQPITVSLRAVTDPGITISGPKSVQVTASGRFTVLLEASRAEAGVHNVSLQLVDTGGQRLGGSATVPIRVAEVSRIIWLFLGVGGALLFGAIAVRLARRVRAARA